MISLSASSETPGDPDRTPADASDEARPRRALGSDGSRQPGSPTTPVRFPSRTAADARRGAAGSTPSDEPAGTDRPAVEEDAPTQTWTWQAPADGQPSNKDEEGTDAPAEKPVKKAAAGAAKPARKGGGPGKGKGGQGKGGPGKGKGGQGKGEPGKGKGGKEGKGGKGGQQLPTRRKQFRVLQGMGPMEPRPQIPDQSHLPLEQRTDLAIKVNGLSITYRTSFEKKPTLRQALMRFGRGQRAVREVEALQDVSFEVRTGTAMGIIGANGAGKSTLMRAMAGILPPTKGSVDVWGRASTLLALGVGFNNSLSGRENIILGGLAAGLSREAVEDRADEIADWTELGDFIDMPMRTYSSGMFSRVAFSVAVHMEPDILMIDEALSTGDAHFKEKASAKMAELRSKARAMFLVSHGLGTIKDLCDEAIWIDKGHLMERGEPNEVVDKYLAHMKAKRSSATMDDL